ncbi:hypothetical protein M8371_32255, partial [Klebsiella pneumoniae]|nr:hypothetical protein [Klebsiella pneumoniae]
CPPPGASGGPPLNAPGRALKAFLREHDKKIGRDIVRSAISAALHVQGVQRVVINTPADDLQIDNTQAARNTGDTMGNGGLRGKLTAPPICRPPDRP